MKIGIDTMAPGIIIGAAFEKNIDEAIHLPDLSDDQKSWIGKANLYDTFKNNLYDLFCILYVVR